MRASNSRVIRRLCEIVVRSHFEPENAVHFLGALRQDDEGHIARRAQASTQPHAILLAELHVEQHQVDARALQRALHAAAARDRGDAKPVGFQMTGKRVARFAVFVDYEYVFVCGHLHLRVHCHERGQRVPSASAVTLRNNSLQFAANRNAHCQSYCAMKLLLQVVLLVSALAARAQEPAEFTVTDIRVEGLQRISEGAVFNSLPVNIGDRLGPQRIREALRALNDTGFFRDVELRRDDRCWWWWCRSGLPSAPSTSRATRRSRTEDLTKSLRNVGLASGKILNRYMLEDMRQYLTDQYFARGRYDVRVDVNVEEQPGNLVDVHVEIAEGKFAKSPADQRGGQRDFQR